MFAVVEAEAGHLFDEVVAVVAVAGSVADGDVGGGVFFGPCC